jgi:hypothetical protein
VSRSLKRGRGSGQGLATVADSPLARLLADASRRVPDPPGLDEVIEDAGCQRLATYYLYSALLAGLIDTEDLASQRWPHELAEPMQRMRLSRLAPRTGRGLDAQLTPAERATWRSPDRHQRLARLLVDLINNGTFGPLCGDADRVRLSAGLGPDLELIKDGRVVGECGVKDHWQLVAQHLAGMPLGGSLATTGGAPESQRAAQVAHQLEETGISHAVSAAVTLAVSLHPLGAAAGLGTRLVRSRIQAGDDEADAFRQLGEELSTLRAEADRELRDMVAGRNT